MAELFPRAGSVIPLGAVIAAVLTNEPVAAGDIVAVTVKVAVPPTGKLTAVFRGPTPCPGQVPPALPEQVHVAEVIATGKVSVTTAPTTEAGPVLLATIV